MSDFNQETRTQELYKREEEQRQQRYQDEREQTQERFQAEGERRQQLFKEQADRQQEMAREANRIRAEQDVQQRDQQAFKEAVKEWDRPDLQSLADQKFEVGDKVQASFSTVSSENDSLQFSKQGAAFENGQTEVREVEVVASVKLSSEQFSSAFDEYSNQPQSFLQGHAGVTNEGVQKAVAVSAPGQSTVVVVPNEQGKAQSFGFEPRPALVREEQAKQGQVRAEAPERRPEPAQQGQAKPESLQPQRITSNRWGAEGISDRWATHESSQRSLQNDINHKKGQVEQAEERVRELLKSREEHLETTKGMKPEEIKASPALSAAQARFEGQGKDLETAFKDLKAKSTDLQKSQNQYAINHANFQADSWGRVKAGGEVMGSKETVQMASRKQDEMRAQVNNIKARQNENPLSQDAQKMADQFENQKQQQKSQQQQAPSATKSADHSLDTSAYMQRQHEQAREQGSKVVVMPSKNEHTLNKLSQIQAKAKEAAETIAKAKEKAESKGQDEQGKDNPKAMRP